VDDFYDLDSLPQAGESVHAVRSLRDIGGKGANQAMILSRCGVDVRFVSVVGDDALGRFVLDELTSENLSAEQLLVAPVATDTSIILVDRQGENIVVTTDAAIRSLREEHVRRALGAAEPGSILLVQGNMSLELTEAALRLARGSGMRTVFNPSPVRPGFDGLWPLVDLLVLNAPEALALTGTNDEEAGAALLQAGVREVVLTLGAAGSLLVTAGGAERVPAVPVEVIDTVGAGDTFLAVLTSSLASGEALGLAGVRRAAAASALTIGRRGVRRAFPTRAELATLL